MNSKRDITLKIHNFWCYSEHFSILYAFFRWLAAYFMVRADIDRLIAKFTWTENKDTWPWPWCQYSSFFHLDHHHPPPSLDAKRNLKWLSVQSFSCVWFFATPWTPGFPVYHSLLELKWVGDLWYAFKRHLVQEVEESPLIVAQRFLVQIRST